MDDEFLTPKEVAKILKLSLPTIRILIKDGKIKTIIIGGNQRKTRRILRGELDRFVAEQYDCDN